MADSAAPRTVHLGMGWFPDQPGGLNRYVRELLGALEAAGDAPRAVVIGPAADAPSSVAVPADTSSAMIPRLLAYAREAQDSRATDVVDAHFALYALLPILTSLRRLPLVVHFHGPWALEAKAGGEDAVRSTLKRRLERVVYRRANEAVVLSRAFGRVLVEEYGVSPWRVNVIPPGVDLVRFSPGDRQAVRRELGLPADAWIALTVRRLVPRMGVDALLAAWGRLALADGLLVVGGDGPLRSELERHAPPDVRFVGRVDDELLPAYYRAADVCVVPTRSLEGFGLVVLEALACGTPVIATDAGGLPEALAGLAHDLIVPVDDEPALAARLAAAADGSRPLPSHSAARAHAERYTWERTAVLHRELYRRTVSGVRRRPLRVVYLDHTAALSGGELALLRLLPALESVDAHVILAEDGPLARKLEQAGISVEVLRLAESARGLNRWELGRASAFAVGSAASGLYALRLAARLKQLKPDLVHTNSLKSALYGGAASRLAHVPVVWHIRDHVTSDSLGPRGTALVRSAARRVPAAVIANSRSTLASLGVDGTVIPSPVLPHRTHRENDNGRPFTVGIVGRIARWKGQHVFLEAFARAFPDGPEQAVVIGGPLFGGDDDVYERELRRLAARGGLDGRVVFTGHVEDVPARLADLDVLVHASVRPEPFGQVVVEGMAAGVPVVATRAGGPVEIIEDGVDGLLVPPDDAGALADTLVRLAADRAARATMSARGRESAKRFYPEAVASEVVRVYRKVLSTDA